jgi:hypothetical protein
MPNRGGEMFVTDEEETANGELALLMTTQSEPEANLIKGILKASGIECVLVTHVPHNLYPFTINGLAAIRIKVLASQLAAANELLRDFEENPDPVPEDDGPPSF